MTKRSTAGFLVATSLVLSQAALAGGPDDQAWFGKLSAGASFFGDPNLKNSQSGSDYDLNMNIGSTINGMIGYDFGRFRLGPEFGTQRAGIDEIIFADDGGLGAALGNGVMPIMVDTEGGESEGPMFTDPVPFSGRNDASGAVRMRSVMMNAIVDLDETNGFEPLIGFRGPISRIRTNTPQGQRENGTPSDLAKSA